MYCPKCGTEKREENNFCSNCGYNFLTRNNPQAVVPTPVSSQTSDSGKAVKIVLIVLGCIFAFIIVLIAAIFIGVAALISNIGRRSNIEVGYEMVPSIYEVTGRYYKVCSIRSSDVGFMGSTSETVVTYCDPLEEEDVEDYIDHLVDEEFFVKEDEHLVRKSDQFELIVEIEDSTISYFVEYYFFDDEYDDDYIEDESVEELKYEM